MEVLYGGSNSPNWSRDTPKLTRIAIKVQKRIRLIISTNVSLIVQAQQMIRGIPRPALECMITRPK